MKVFHKKLSKKGGFSLVELMVVVAIIGILAAIAVPKFNQFRAKAVRAEAQNSLGSLHSLQHLYFAENDAFIACTAPGCTELPGFVVSGNARYGYSSTGGNTFTGTATAAAPLCPGDPDSDTLTVDENATIAVTTDGLDGC